MTIKEFIEAAVEGGWRQIDPQTNKKYEDEDWDYLKSLFINKPKSLITVVVLDPKAWKAVGKVMMKHRTCINCGNCNWKDSEKYPNTEECIDCGFKDDTRTYSFAREKMTKMVQELCNGQTLEEYISTL